MSDLTTFRDHCRQRAAWMPGKKSQICTDRGPFGLGGLQIPAQHQICRWPECGCSCHAPTDADRDLFTRLADEIDDYLEPDNSPDLFGT